MSAQKLSDEITENAQVEAGRIVREAESRADLLLQKCQLRVEEVQREIDGMRLKRRDVETGIESIISTLQNTLEYVREQDTRHREEKILLHRPRPTESAPSPAAVVVDLDDPIARTSQG
jgi:hypothetical protein